MYIYFRYLTYQATAELLPQLVFPVVKDMTSREKCTNEKIFLEGNTMKAAVISRINRDTKFCYYSRNKNIFLQDLTIFPYFQNRKKKKLQSGLTPSLACVNQRGQEYLTPTSFTNVVINAREIPRSNAALTSCCLQKLFGLSRVTGPCQHRQNSSAQQPPSCCWTCRLPWWLLCLTFKGRQKNLSRAKTHTD